jgi:hypothetical protein
MSQLALYSQFSQFSGVGGGTQYPDPFLDIASLSVPTNMRSALRWCEYVFSMFGTYRMAMERIISYFLTDIDISDASEEETEKWSSFLNDVLNVTTVLQNKLRNRMCFHGDVKVVTRDGVFRLRDLAGQTVEVLSRGGVYRTASFHSFGQQELLEVELSDGSVVLATPEHQWIVHTCVGEEFRVPTTELSSNHRIQRTVAPRPPQDADFDAGVLHGLAFGASYLLLLDGEQCTARFGVDLDDELLARFTSAGYVVQQSPGNPGMVMVAGLPARYQALPPARCGASYWYGFVAGLLAAEGSVDEHGHVVLARRSRSTLEAIAEQLPRIGMVAGHVHGHDQVGPCVRPDGSIGTYHGRMYHVTLLRSFLLAQDFLRRRHRKRFLTSYLSVRPDEMSVGVRAVRRTGIFDEVFCCVEPETHSFVLANGVLTSNCYGNSFASVVVPFRRFLRCPKCGSSFVLKEVYNNPAFSFRWQIPEFHATCPICKVGSGYTGAWIVHDEQEDLEKKLRIKVWSPHEIEILHDLYTDDVSYLWRIPEDYKMQVRRGHLFHLERAPKEVIRAVHLNQMYRFNPDAIFHMKEPTLSGIMVRGWGLPRILSNFRQIWYVQVLRRFNEAIALDYVIPFRVITPAPAQGQSRGGVALDPMSMYSGHDFRMMAQQMIRRRRRDPAAIQVFPFPVNFQVFGADANQLAPRDLLDQGHEVLLNDAGTPVELYNGSLQLQTAPVALRLFESTWHHLVHDANAFLEWLVRQVSQIMSWEIIVAKLKRVTIADNLEKQMMAAQLMMSQQISGTTVLRDLGYDWHKEQRRIAEEARFQAEMQSRIQEEMQQAGFAQQVAKGQLGAAPADASAPDAGGATQGGGMVGAMTGQGPVTAYLASVPPNVPQSPEDMLSVADSLATELLSLPESVKDSELRKLKQYNLALHGMVKDRMAQKRNETRRAAGNAALAQAQAGAPVPV